jgi:pimeloyl-ACP methyl ester carboxylesterase
LAAKQISLFGHSLGTYVSTEIGKLFNKVNSIVALDPAASGLNSGGDKFDRNGNTSDQEKLIDFRDAAEKSVAFVASDERGGLAGDNDRAATANDSFIVRFEDDRPFAFTDIEYHGGVVEVFTDLLSNNNLSLSNYQRNWFGNRGGEYSQPTGWSHEGVISANKVGGTWKAKTLTRVPGSDKATWV